MPQLKKYLRDRGIPFSNYTKRDLQEMVKKCVVSPHLVDVIEANEDAGVKAQRRQIEINGKVEFFPDPLSLGTWKKTLGNMPSVSLDKATLYLLFKMRWSQTRLTNLKKERGYLMFQSKHIHEVCLKEMKHGFIYIKAKCTRQTAQSEAPYVVWMLATGEGNIECAGCQCIG